MSQFTKRAHRGGMLAIAAILLAAGCHNAPPQTKAQNNATTQHNAMAASELQRIENDPNSTQADKERAIAQLRKTQ